MSNGPPRICVVGSSNMDVTFCTPRLPRPGETLSGRSFATGFGGKGANQAVMAARLGAHVSMIGRVGRDLFGDQLLRNCRDQGIDTTHVLIEEDCSSGVAGIVVDDDGNNCIIVIPGANGRVTAADVRAAAPLIESADVLLCQLEIPIFASLEALRLARAAQTLTLFNPAPAVPLPDEIFALTDLCLPNETELELLTGRTTGDPAACEAAARALLQRGAGAVLVTLGPRGALLVEPQASVTIPAPAVRAVDTTGAGDAFIGSLAVFLAEGRPRRNAIRLANGVAALTVTRPGTQTAFPTRSEVEPLLQFP